MAGAIIVPVVELIRRDLGLGGTAAGLIITTHGLTIALASPAAGWSIDRWGVRRPLAGGLVLYGIAGGAGLLASSYAALLASRVAFGAGAAIVFTGTTVALLALYRGAERDRVMGWRSTATSLGGVTWPLLGGALGGLSWHGPFGVYLIGIPIGIAALAVLPETRVEGERPSFRALPALLARHPALMGLYTLQATSAILLYALVVFLPQRLDQLDVLAPFTVSVYLVLSGAIASVVGLVYGSLRAHLSYATLLRTAAAAWMLAFLVLGTTSKPGVLFLATALFGLGQGLSFPALAVLVGESAPAAQRGQATSLSATANFLGQFASPVALGPLIAATRITTGFLAAGLVAALVLVALTTPRARAILHPTERCRRGCRS